jgi:hypothetical protein
MCKRPDSSVGRAAIRYSEGPGFESPSDWDINVRNVLYIAWYVLIQMVRAVVVILGGASVAESLKSLT